METDAELQRTTSPLQLPANAFQHIVLQLPDPSSLAATCHAAAALLDDDELLLGWFEGAVARSTAANNPAMRAVAQHRHPGYALLLWRRLHSMRTPRLAALLLRWLGRCSPASSEASDRRSRAQQLLDGGDALAALQALLPHSDHLLLQYAAQGGQTQLLGELLAAPGAAASARLCWDAETHMEYSSLRVAVFSAVHGGHADASHMLLAALQASGLSQEQLGWVHDDLLSTAITTGSRSRGCLQALLQLSRSSPHMQRHLTDRLQSWLPDVTDEGMQHELLSAVAAFPNGAEEVYNITLHSGLISMAQRYKPAQMSGEQAARRFCKAAVDWVGSDSSEAHLEQLAKAMLRLERDDREVIWRDVLSMLFSRGCVAGLQAIWAEFSRPGEAALAKQDMVDAMFISMLPTEHSAYRALLSTTDMKPMAHLECMRWFGEHAASHLSTALKRTSGTPTALMLLRDGHKELLPFVQPPEATARQIASDMKWRAAQLGGEVKWAVRRGDVGAVQAALAAFAAMDAPAGGAAAMLVHVESVAQLACRALEDAAALADFEVASEKVRALAARFDGEEGVDDALDEALMAPGVAMAHGGAFLRMACEASPTVRGQVAGPESQSSLCWEVCKNGLGGLAQWLCVQPGQRGDYLAEVCQEPCGPELNCFTHNSARTLSSFTQLLYSLAAKGGSSPSGQQGAELGSIGSGGGGGGGGGLGSAEMDSSSSGPPAGARQLTQQLLCAVVYSGSPDLLHALLVFVDAWGPGADMAE